MIRRIRNRSAGTTAVVLFTGNVRREERRKRLPQRFLSAIHASLINETRGIDQCDVYVCGDAPARDSAVGHIAAASLPVPQQISTAVTSLFANHQRVVLVAGDVCGLQREHIAEALRHLDREGAQAAVGRSTDGGFYLAAFNRPPQIDWTALPWFEPAIGDALIAALQAGGFQVSAVQPLADIDDAGDARRVLGTFLTVRNMPLQARAILCAALAGFVEAVAPARPFFFASALSNRPPPARS